MAFRHKFGRITVAKLVEREGASRGDPCALLEQVLGVELGEHMPATQVPLAIARDQSACLRDRHAMPNRRERVLQGQPSPDVHVYVARRHQRQAQLAADHFKLAYPPRIVRSPVQLNGQPRTIAERLLHPATMCHVDDQLGGPQNQRAW